MMRWWSGFKEVFWENGTPMGGAKFTFFQNNANIIKRSGRLYPLLIKLHLCGLDLEEVPSYAWHFKHLQELFLDKNQLSIFPETEHWSWYESLQTLSLRSNQLITLPTRIVDLENLSKIYLDDNPLQTPPEIIKQGIPAIRGYLRTQQATVAKAAKELAPIATPPVPIQPQLTKSTPAASPVRPITIFYCYAREDRDLRDRIDSHLGMLKRTGLVVGWHDREIQAGTEWEQEIKAHLSTANIILLLVSADFVNSEYCYGVEMQRALEMHEKKKARVIPILLRPVDWQDAPFAKLQFLPTGAKPITRWPDPEEALEDVARQIRAVVNALRPPQS